MSTIDRDVSSTNGSIRSTVTPGVLSDTFCYEQDEPQKLCYDRELTTSEIHESNDFYGQASVLKRYAGLPHWYSLKVVLEHAPVVQDEMWRHDRRARLPVNLSCTEPRAKAMQQHSGRPSVAVGFGFLYASKLVDQQHGPPRPSVDRTGTLVFPFKSTHHISTEFDHADYAQRLAALPDYMQPMTVCIFWKDYLRGAHQAYEDAGHTVVTAGHMFDPNFLLRLYDICRRFRFAVSNEFGTHVFLSVASGCSYSFVESSQIKRHVPDAHKQDYVRDMPGFQKVRQRCFELFDGRNETVSREQQDFVDSILGTSSFKSPNDLRRILLQAEFRDKFGPLSRRGDHPIVQVVPAFHRRSFRRLRMLPKRAIGHVLATNKH